MKFVKSFIRDKEFWLLSLIKELIAICVLLPLLYNFCNAWLYGSWDQFDIVGSSSTWTNINSWNNIICVKNGSNRAQYSYDGNTVAFELNRQNKRVCMTWDIYHRGNSPIAFRMQEITCPTCPTIDSNYCTSNNLCPTCPTCPTCEEQYTSLECQTEYNLIPVSDVTENYCTANFDLISPADCPISSWSWDTQWSALFLNNVQYAGASNIYINVSDALDYSTTYIDSGSSFVFDVDWYVADTWYLNDILTIQEYHPNSEDFTVAFVGGLTLLLPYVVIVLFVVAIWTIIKKIFKS